MSVPAYASHLSEETYAEWKKYLPYFMIAPGGRHGFHLPEIKSVADARAMIAMAATSESVAAALDRGNCSDGSLLTYHGGHNPQPMAAAFSLHDEAQEACIQLAKALTDDSLELSEAQKFHVFAYVTVCGNTIRQVPVADAAMAGLCAFADALPIEEDAPGICGAFNFASGRNQFYFAQFYRLLGATIGAQHRQVDARPVPASLAESCRAAALRYFDGITRSHPGHHPLRHVMEHHARDEDILDRAAPLRRVYIHDVERSWNAEKEFAEKEKQDFAQKLTSRIPRLKRMWALEARGRMTDAEMESGFRSAIHPWAFIDMIVSPRTTPGGPLLPPVDFERECPDFAAEVRAVRALTPELSR